MTKRDCILLGQLGTFIAFPIATALLLLGYSAMGLFIMAGVIILLFADPKAKEPE